MGGHLAGAHCEDARVLSFTSNVTKSLSHPPSRSLELPTTTSPPASPTPSSPLIVIAVARPHAAPTSARMVAGLLSSTHSVFSPAERSGSRSHE
eukprot:879481-Rhodomonas_salina.1